MFPEDVANVREALGIHVVAPRNGIMAAAFPYFLEAENINIFVALEEIQQILFSCASSPCIQ
jgi:hypothetical protein